jgi:hypothetical protein
MGKNPHPTLAKGKVCHIEVPAVDMIGLYQEPSK